MSVFLVYVLNIYKSYVLLVCILQNIYMDDFQFSFFWDSFIHSFNKNELSTCMLGFALGAEDIASNTNKNICSYEPYLLVEDLFSLCIWI